MMSDKNARKSPTTRAFIAILTILIITLSTLSSTTLGEEQHYPQQTESQPDRILSHNRPILFMYGIQDNQQTHDQWILWNHAALTDPESDDNLFEQGFNGLGNPNNGGGGREFTFKACVENSCNPGNDTVLLDDNKSIEGFFTLEIFCQNDAGCRRDVSITIGDANKGADLQTIFIEGPDEIGGDKYSFVFDQVKLEEIKPGDIFDFRISFTKSSGQLDYYDLGLGREYFEITFPTLPPEVSEVDVEPDEFGKWKSPYSNSELGFVSQSVTTTSITGPMIWGFLCLTLLICGLIFLPPIPFKPIFVPATSIMLLMSMCIAPLISWLDVAEHRGDTDPKLYTVDELAGLYPQEGSFLGDLKADDQFEVWVEYSQLYRKKVEIKGEEKMVFGLGMEKYNNALADTESTSQKGREFVQLYFSLLEFDASEGSGVLIRVQLVEDSQSDKIVPHWALSSKYSHHNVSIGTAQYRWMMPTGEYPADGCDTANQNATEKEEHSLLTEECMTTIVMGQQVSWRFIPIYLTPLAFGLVGYGVWIYRKELDGEEVWNEDFEYEL
jgi:hypothetical protein